MRTRWFSIGAIGDSKDTDYLLAQGCEDKGADMILSCTEDTGKSTINNGKFISLSSSQIIQCGQVCNHSHFTFCSFSELIPAVAAVHLGGLKRGGSEDLQAMALVDDIDVEDSNTIGKDADYLHEQGV